MKNKKFTYFVLLPAVLFVWGLIIHRIMDSRSEDNTPISVLNYPPKPEEIVAKKDYQLLNSYNDPFSSHKAYSSKCNEASEVVKPKNQKRWPEIRLNGYVVNGTKIKCHLTVNNDDRILQENEKILEDFIVSRITPDSVKISCKGDSRWYKN